MNDKTKPASINWADDSEESTPEERGGKPRLSILNSGRKEPSADLDDAALEGDDVDDEDEDEDADEVSAPKSKKAKKGKGTSPKLFVGLGVGFLAVVLAAGVIVIQKKRAAAVYADSMQDVGPQPQIVSPPPVAPAGVQPTAGTSPTSSSALVDPRAAIPSSATVVAAPGPVTVLAAESIAPVPPPVPGAGAVQPLPTAQTVQAAAAAPQPAPPSAVAAAANTPSSDAVAKDIAAMKESMLAIMRRIERIEQQQATLRAKPAVAQIPAPGAAVPASPSASPKPAQIKVRGSRKDEPAPAVERRVEPTTLSNYWVSGIVNDRAFIVRRNSDGTETEQSVVAGDRLESGARVLKINANDKVISLDGGQQISARPR